MKTITSVKLDKEVKKEAGKLASALGLNLSLIINASLKKFVSERRVVFSLRDEFNAKTQNKFLKIKTDIKKGKNLSKTYTDFNEMYKDLGI